MKKDLFETIDHLLTQLDAKIRECPTTDAALAIKARTAKLYARIDALDQLALSVADYRNRALVAQ